MNVKCVEMTIVVFFPNLSYVYKSSSCDFLIATYINLATFVQFDCASTEFD